MADKVAPSKSQKTTTPEGRESRPRPRRHVGSTADFVETAPVVGGTSLPPKPTITPAFEEEPAPAEPKTEPKREAQAATAAEAAYKKWAASKPKTEPKREAQAAPPVEAEAEVEPKPKPEAQTMPKPLPATPEPVHTGSGMFTFRMKQETLVLLALVVCSLLLGAFILGHRVGKFRTESKMADETPARHSKKAVQSKNALAAKRREQSNRTIQIGSRDPAPAPTPTPQTPAPAPAPAPADSSEVWTLCVITYTAAKEDRAEQLKRVLSEAVPAQYKVFLKRSGKRRLVCVGHFNSSRDPVLGKLRTAISKMKFDGKQQFHDCYPVQLQR